jgi:hypothetical protein
MDFIPKSASFAARQLNFSRSRFRIETQGSKESGPNQSISFQLPENALLDLKSLRIHANVKCTTPPTISTHVTKAPADFSSLIASFSVFVGGVCVSQSNNDYAEVCRILKLVKSSRDRDGSIDTTLTHGTLDGDTTDDDFDVAYTPTTGMFDSSVRYFPSMLTGSVTLMINFKSNACLTYMKKSDKAFDDGYITAQPDATTLALAQASFKIDELYATIDTINMDSGLYEAMLLDQINRDEAIKMVYKEYLTFRKSNLEGSTAEHSISLSSSSVDVLYTVFQNTTYNTSGIPGHKYMVKAYADAYSSNQLFFTSCNGASKKKVDRSGLKYQYFINNVPQSSFQSNVLDAAADLSILCDRTNFNSNGHMITSLSDFQTGKAIFPCVLNMQETPSFVRTGYSCRGSNSTCSISFTGLTMPTAESTKGIESKVSMLTVAECSQVMHIKGGRQLQIEY